MKKHSLIMCLLAAMCLPLMHAHAQRKGTKTNGSINQGAVTPGKVQKGGTTTTTTAGSAGATLLNSTGKTATNPGAVKRKPVETFIAQVKATTRFVPITNIWTPDNQYDKSALLKNVQEVQPLTIDYTAVADMVNRNLTAISLVIPGAGGTTYTVELAQYNPLANDFKVIGHGRDGDKVLPFTPGKYYSGVVKDVPGSVAAFTFYKGEVHGIFSMPGVGNIVVTPNTLAGTNYENLRYVLYNDRDLKNMQMAGCGSDRLPSHDELDVASRTTTTLNNNIYNNCKQIRLMSIVDFATRTSLGSDVAVITYMTSIFNNKAVLYRNEGVLLEFKVLQINTATDEYAALAGSSINFLKMLGGVVQNTHKTTYGCDVAQLFSTKYPGIGGVAWRPGLCLSYNSGDSSGSYAFSGLNGSSSAFPTYSWNVEVSTHELGHVLGSHHTHACVWGPTRTTAIDGCYAIEGGCADPGDPSGAVGGTIMSYCHLVGGVGINFSNGFGTQPGDTVRYRIGIQGASCGAQYNPSVALPIASRTVTANRECQDLTSGRTYYWYDANTASENDDTLVLIIVKGSNTIGDLNTGLTITANTISGWGGGTGQAISFPGGTSGVLSNNVSMRRYWNISGATTPAGAVEVLYPFLGTDTADIKGSVAASAMPNYKIYKVNSPINPNPASGFSGAVAGDFSIYTNAGSPSSTNWALTNIGNTLLARMNMTNLNGGGTAFFSSNGSITGTTTVCVNATTQLSSSSGGVWTSANTTVATVDGTGLVTGVAAGTATISYDLGGTPSTALVTVVGAPGAFGGLTTVCVGSSIVVSNSTAGGVWSSQTSGVATVNSAARTVFGASGGNANIKYSTGCGTDGILAITVTPAPGAIQGASTVCVGSMIFMSNAVTGGAWSATTTHVSVSPTSGDVLGLTAGTTVIKYSTGCGTDASKTVTVNAAPGGIGGPATVCQGSTITLTNAIAGGAWTSSNTSVATVNSGTRVVTGVGAGTANIMYSTGCGSDASLAVTVNPSPGAIQGSSTVCVGSMIFMSNAVTGGAWSATTTHVSVSPTSGDVLGLTAGTTDIKYSTGCGTDASKTVTVKAAPGGIGGPATVCQGSTITLTNAIAGGVWTSSNTSVATVNSGTRVVTGVGAGTANIMYSTGCGSDASVAITVNPSPGAIQGPSTVCVGSMIFMSNAVTGGAWSATTTHVSVSPTSGDVLGLAAGTTVIKYSTGCGTDASKTVTVKAAPGGVTGATEVCEGSSITLNNATAGGTWFTASSDATVVAGTGVVTGVSDGSATIVYSTGCGSNATHDVTVNARPLPIIGTLSVMAGNTTQLSSATPGGVWSSTNPAKATVDPATGLVYGVTTGTTVISYTNVSGCAAVANVSVSSSFVDGYTVCIGQSVVMNDGGDPGGTWTSGNGSIATVGLTSGIATGVGVGTVIMYYNHPSGMMTATLTVNPLSPTIGLSSLCVGSSITLTNATPGGGVWSSDNTNAATVNASGVVTGAAPGNAIITFTSTAGCATTHIVEVSGAGSIDGATAVCTGQTITLSNTAGGGAWSSSNGSLATVSAGGAVTGVAAGKVRISYILGTGCQAVTTITVNQLYSVMGNSNVCQGSTISLSNSTPGGGAWESDNTGAATVNGSGLVTGTGAGVAVISFTANTGGCVATRTITVSSAGTVSGLASVCVGQTIALSNSVGGGAWSSSNGSLATVSAGGAVSGVSAGTVRISYIVGGCQSVATVTVNTVLPITGGTSSMCQGGTMTLANATGGGGVWSSGNTAIAVVSSGGVVTGTGGGVATISFTANNACVVTRTVSITAAPAVTGNLAVCTGQTTQLSNGGAAGAWSSSSAALATVTSGGLVGGVNAGTVRITFMGSTGCMGVATVTVNALSQTTGLASVCQGQSITLANTTSGGGVWSSANSSVATVNSSGVVTGASAGTVAISFTATTGGCVTTRNMTVIGAGTISGTLAVCVGQSTPLSVSTGGGNWSTSSGALATISAAGVLWGVSSGTPRVSYIWPTGCQAVATVTVRPLMQTTGGTTGMCASGTMMLTNLTPGGGVWTTSNTSIATVSASGAVKGVSPGVVHIFFTAGSGCVATRTVIVNACREAGGSSSGTTIATVDIVTEVQLFPNPNNGVFTLTGNVSDAAVTQVDMEIINAVGQVVYRTSAPVQNGRINEHVDIGRNAASGNYLLRVRTDQGSNVFRFVVGQ